MESYETPQSRSCRDNFMESAILIHELRNSGMRAKWANVFYGAFQRVNKYRTKYFSWCYLFTLLVLRRILEFLPHES